MVIHFVHSSVLFILRNAEKPQKKSERKLFRKRDYHDICLKEAIYDSNQAWTIKSF